MSYNYTNIPQNLNTGYYQQSQQNPNFTASGTPITTGAAIENNPLINAAASTPDNPAKFLAAMGISTAALFGINNFINNPLQSKKYDQTFFNKVEKYIDNNISSKPKVKKFTDYLHNLKVSVSRQIDKSEILRTMFRKPSIGGPMAQSQAVSSRGHIATRAIEIMKKYKEAHPGFTEFDAIIKKAEKDSYKYLDEIIQTINNSSANLKEIITKKPAWGFGIIKNKSSLQEILNKNRLINNYKNSGKTLGQKASGYLMRATECLTNGMFSGKGAVLLQALMIAQSYSEASKAEKGEKFSTFMASLTELMAFMATMGIQMRITNSLAGLKYIGMTKPQYEKYLELVEKANGFAKTKDLAQYKNTVAQIKALKDLGKANTKWYQKPIKWIGKVVGYGRIRETVKPLKASKASTLLAKIPYGLKVGLGYAGRVGLIMAAIIPIFSGAAKKISYAIFGKPVKTLEREKAKESASEQPSQVVPQQQQTTQNPNSQTFQQQPLQTTQTVSTGKPGNLLETMNNMHNNPAIGSQTVTPVVQQQSPIQSPDAGIVRTYIPNPILGTENVQNVAATRSARIDAVLRQADYAEAMAQRYL